MLQIEMINLDMHSFTLQSCRQRTPTRIKLRMVSVLNIKMHGLIFWRIWLELVNIAMKTATQAH